MSLHVVHVGAGPDALRRSAAELLAAWPTLRDVAEAVSAAGVRVTVVQAAHAAERITRDGVTYELVPVAGRRRGAATLARAVARLQPDVVHLHGIGFALHAWTLHRALPHTPLLVQDHADRVPQGARRAAARALLRSIDAVAFTAAEQAEPFITAGVLAPHTRIVQVPESSSHFTPGDRAQARRAFGLGDESVVAWIGRLVPVKQPLRALDVFRRALARIPDARMLWAFGDATMLPQLETALAADPALANRVTLLGRLPRAQVELLLRAADVFLGTSEREGSGYALIEALACGATPVVSAIPAFRGLTNDGVTGRLFAPDDVEHAARALTDALLQPLPRADVRRYFDEHLSFACVGRTLAATYEDLAMHALDSLQPRPPLAPIRRRIVLLVPGGVDRSGTTRVIPCILALIERLARQVDLHVLALRQERHACSYELLGARVECVPAGSRTGALRALLRLHRERRIDALHALWMHPQGTTAAIAGALLDVPVVLHLNGGDLACVPAAQFGGRATLPGRVRLRAAVAGATHVTVPSAAAARDARALGIEPEVLTLGVALDRWPIRPPQTARRFTATTLAAPAADDDDRSVRLISVADLRPVKDHATLLRAFAQLLASGRSAHLDCIGHDTMTGTVQRMAGQLGVAHAVAFHETMPHARLRGLVEDADALVVSSRYEGDPIAALEAAIAGVPVIGTRVGHLDAWSSAGAALTCDVGDVDGLAECMARIADDDALRTRLAHNAQRFARAADADAAAARVLELYDILAARERPIPTPAPV